MKKIASVSWRKISSEDDHTKLLKRVIRGPFLLAAVNLFFVRWISGFANAGPPFASLFSDLFAGRDYAF